MVQQLNDQNNSTSWRFLLVGRNFRALLSDARGCLCGKEFLKGHAARERHVQVRLLIVEAGATVALRTGGERFLACATSS